jgi:hypothetical protein
MFGRKKPDVVGLVKEILLMGQEYAGSECLSFDSFLIRQGIPERTVRRYRSMSVSDLDMASFVVKRREKCLEEERVKLSSLMNLLLENFEEYELYQIDGLGLEIAIASATEKRMKLR